ncbi:LOW QUALITY PROTEIN: hypothetical protein CVT25_008032 [Psilocybe cyanescens]|uniref:Uncharacterized protein n=1 Tax=Psilocybe cyanescens TaxID=93625 RepID=A0A409XT65_PSICY|nr:LOW QUALITY PROTEIN: hypothetical protein CVT25_008032 [Psilocybe cyanescens]
MAASDSEDEDANDLPQRATEFDECTAALFKDSNLDSDNEGMPNLQSVSDSDSDDNERDTTSLDFSDGESVAEVDSDFNNVMIFDNVKEDTYEWEDYVSDNDAAYKTSYTVEELTTPATEAHIDLYNSGTTRHMSGAKDRFLNLILIEPKLITAADNRLFSATAKGDMIIHVPNGSSLPSPSKGCTICPIDECYPGIDPNPTATNHPATPHSPKMEAPTKATIEDVNEEEDKDEDMAEPTNHVPVDDFQPHRSSRICTESDYVCHLQQGVGLTSARPSALLLPTGVQEGNEKKGGGMANEEDETGGIEKGSEGNRGNRGNRKGIEGIEEGMKELEREYRGIQGNEGE